jgi:hypothetical protein
VTTKGRLDGGKRRGIHGDDSERPVSGEAIDDIGE